MDKLNDQVAKVLLVEDEPHIAFNLKLNLEASGYEVHSVVDGASALAEVRKHNYSLVLLDVMIPEPNGFEVASIIRSQDDRIAIIMITACAADEERIRGLSIGVDDYVTKPFHLQELMLKVKRAVDRANLFEAEGSQETNASLSAVLKVGGFTLNSELLTLERADGKISNITALESDVLREFMLNVGTVLSRDYLLCKVWHLRGQQETRTVDNFVLRLRKFLELDPTNPKVLLSIRGRGYCFVDGSGDPTNLSELRIEDSV